MPRRLRQSWSDWPRDRGLGFGLHDRIVCKQEVLGRETVVGDLLGKEVQDFGIIGIIIRGLVYLAVAQACRLWW